MPVDLSIQNLRVTALGLDGADVQWDPPLDVIAALTYTVIYRKEGTEETERESTWCRSPAALPLAQVRLVEWWRIIYFGTQLYLSLFHEFALISLFCHYVFEIPVMIWPGSLLPCGRPSLIGFSMRSRYNMQDYGAYTWGTLFC